MPLRLSRRAIGQFGLADLLMDTMEVA